MSAIRYDAIDDLLERMRKMPPNTMQRLPFDMFVLINKSMPFFSSPLAGQSLGREPGAPVATGSWTRATCEKRTWVPKDLHVRRELGFLNIQIGAT